MAQPTANSTHTLIQVTAQGIQLPDGMSLAIIDGKNKIIDSSASLADDIFNATIDQLVTHIRVNKK